MPCEEDRQPSAWEDRSPADIDAAGSDESDQEPVQQAVPSTSGRRPVWDDPDDNTAQVNIAAQPRLRKLRKTEQDGIVSGKQRLNDVKHLDQGTSSIMLIICSPGLMPTMHSAGVTLFVALGWQDSVQGLVLVLSYSRMRRAIS